MLGRRVTVLGAALAVVLSACSGDDQAPSPQPQSAGRAAAREAMVMWRATIGTPANPRTHYDIVVIDAKHGRPRVLTPPLDGAARPLLFDRPAWSPDGRLIAFTVELDGTADKDARPQRAKPSLVTRRHSH